MNLCPEDELGVLLVASAIPDKATVTKRTGEKRYALCHSLKVYQHQGPNAPPLVLEGFFLVGERGDVNQIAADALLVWRIAAEDFVETVRNSWEIEQ